jgi:hypothetical protein
MCGKKVQRELMVFISHTEDHIAEEIKKKHPEWKEESGVCRKCLDYYKEQLKGQG